MLEAMILSAFLGQKLKTEYQTVLTGRMKHVKPTNSIVVQQIHYASI